MGKLLSMDQRPHNIMEDDMGKGVKQTWIWSNYWLTCPRSPSGPDDIGKLDSSSCRPRKL